MDDYQLTYGALDGAARRVVTLLRDRGLQPGDRVGLMLPNVPAFALSYYGALGADAVVVPMNPLLKQREVEYYLGDSGAKILFAWHEFAAEAEVGAKAANAAFVAVSPGEFEQLVASYEPATDVVRRGDLDTAVILYTSGTTGKPKGAELTHAGLDANQAVTRAKTSGAAHPATSRFPGRSAVPGRAHCADADERLRRIRIHSPTTLISLAGSRRCRR